MNTSIIKPVIGALLCAGMPFAYAADEPLINISSRTEHNAPRIIVRSVYNFEKSISVKLQTDPSLVPSDVLISMVSKIGMVDAHGIKITSGFDIDLTHNLILSFSGGTSEIIQTAGTPQELNIIASFKDNNGNFVSPSADSLAVYSIDGQKLCFEYKDVIKDPPKMAFTLVVDRSGSMAGVIDDVRNATQSFLSALPASAECAVVSFNSGFSYHNSHYQNCNSGNFKLNTLNAQGGTNLYEAWLSAYTGLSQPYFDGYQKAVIIITDGQIAIDNSLRQKITTEKKDILSFVYFLGEKSDQQLVGLADGFLHNTSDIKANLAQYFQSLSTAYRTQKVLSVTQCQGGSNANP